jgi:predicted RNA binding protein YcfA (HicA-like mRNA interferase family)
MIKKVKEMIRIIELDGWVLYAQKGSHKQYKHPIKKGESLFPIMVKVKY